MVTVWLPRVGIIYHSSSLSNDTSFTADMYCEELDTRTENLRPALGNRTSPLLLHSNARPHTAQQTVSKLQEDRIEKRLKVLRHTPYSPNFAPTDFYFFQSLDNFLVEKTFNNLKAVTKFLLKVFWVPDTTSSRRIFKNYDCAGRDASIP